MEYLGKYLLQMKGCYPEQESQRKQQVETLHDPRRFSPLETAA